MAAQLIRVHRELESPRLTLGDQEACRNRRHDQGRAWRPGVSSPWGWLLPEVGDLEAERDVFRFSGSPHVDELKMETRPVSLAIAKEFDSADDGCDQRKDQDLKQRPVFGGKLVSLVEEAG